jgi:hypothetical protein
MLHGVVMLDGVVNPPDKHFRPTDCRIAIVHPSGSRRRRTIKKVI